MIKIDNLFHYYSQGKDNETIALDGVNLEINEGEFVVILGHNGCGKSTLAKHLNSLLLPGKGDVVIDGLDSKDESKLWEIRKKVGMVFQNPDNQLVATTVEEDVAFGMENLGISQDLMKERIELLNSFKIPINRFYTFIHHTATVAKSAKIGYGTAIMANTVVNPNAIIGNYCTIHSNSLIGHDTKMGSYNFVAAHNVIGSSSIIGDSNFFGLNSTFNNYIEIGDFNFVGMASNVVKGLDSNQKVYGNPAREFFKDIKPL